MLPLMDRNRKHCLAHCDSKPPEWPARIVATSPLDIPGCNIPGRKRVNPIEVIALLLSPMLVQISYQVPQKMVAYTLTIGLDGYIPVIMHRDAKVRLDVGISVQGLPPGAAGVEKAVTDVTTLKLSVDGSVIPSVDRNAVDQYFPESVTLSPQGNIIDSNMPKQVDLPIHLPGVDIKHFPDLSFLAVEFPAQGIEQGTPWTFTRSYGDSTVAYTVTPTSVTDDRIDMNIAFTQDYKDQEGDAYEPVQDPRDAAFDVATHVQGAGTVEFDRKLGLVSQVHVQSDAKGDVTDLATKAVSHRDLKTSIDASIAS